MKRFFVLCFFVVGGILMCLRSLSMEKMHDIENSPTMINMFEGKSSLPVKRDLEFGKMPLDFIPNRGQVDERARFYAKTSRFTLWMTKEGLIFDSICHAKTETEDFAPSSFSVRKGHAFPEKEEKLLRDVSRLIFLDANKNARIVSAELTGYKVNYFKGSDPLKWQPGINTSKAVLYENLYENIDLKVYGVETQVEYDWIVKPGADPKHIRFHYQGDITSHIDKDGNLAIDTKFGKLLHKKPIGYQVIEGKKVEVESQFKKIEENIYGFELKTFNRNYELIIDPVVMPIYSTYLGGKEDDYGQDIAVDGNGYVYITGYTLSSDFPVKNPYIGTKDVSRDVFVTKLSPLKGNPVYSTFLGGNSYDCGYAIAVDTSGSAYVTGYTMSSNFPTMNPFQGSLRDIRDAFVVKLSPAGDSLVYSTYLGGSNQEFSWDITVDQYGSAYITGDTSSSDFPTRNAYQEIFMPSANAFVTKFSPAGNSLIYSTYLGGEGTSNGKAIAVDGQGCIYIMGITRSLNFPTMNPYQGTLKGESDVFLTKFSAAGNQLVYSTYLGGSLWEHGVGLAIDSHGSAYVVGDTVSTDFPTKNPYQGTLNGNRNAFVTKFSPAGNDLAYSTYLGGNDSDYGNGIAVDRYGSAYIMGNTSSKNFPTKNAYQKRLKGVFDAFALKLNPGGSGLIFSTFLGGSKDELGNGIALDGNGNIYLVGITNSTNFPTHSAFQRTLSGEFDAFVTGFGFRDSFPILAVNKTLLSFTQNKAGKPAHSQEFSIGNSGEGTLNWTISSDADWIECSPGSGTNFGVVTVSIHALDLSPGVYAGKIIITDDHAGNSPLLVGVLLKVYYSSKGYSKRQEKMSDPRLTR